MNEIIPDADRGLFNTLKPFMEHWQGVRDIKECIWLLVSEDFMNPVVYLRSLFMVKSSASLEQKMIYLIIFVGNKIEFTLFCF